jgi:hypothetical protein
MISLPNTINISKVADWVELFVVSENKKISKMKIHSLFNEEGVDLDDKIDNVMIELNRRTQLYGKKSPIKIKGLTIEPTIKWKDNPFHTMCLIYSTYGVQDNPDKGTTLFERIGNILLKEFLRSQTFHLGFPTSKNLAKQLDNVAIRLCELRGAQTPDPSEKDGGVDVTSWLPFNDSRSSQIIVLAQCGAGDDWKKKKPISLTTWVNYINWNYETTVPSMIITQIVQADKWRKYYYQYGVLIDRARLYRIHSGCQAGIPKPLFTAALAWCQTKLN